MAPYKAITRDSRHPFETYMLVACTIGGMSALSTDLWPSSIEAAFPLMLQRLWGLALGGGAILALAGIAWKRRDTGIQMEQIGLMCVGGACLTYAAAILVYNMPQGFVSLALFALLGAASIRQWFRLEKFIKDSIRTGKTVRRRDR